MDVLTRELGKSREYGPIGSRIRPTRTQSVTDGVAPSGACKGNICDAAVQGDFSSRLASDWMPAIIEFGTVLRDRAIRELKLKWGSERGR